MCPGEFTPKKTQESSSGRHFNPRERFDTLAVSQGMSDAANAAYPLTKENVLAKAIKLGCLFNSSMNITDYRRYTHYLFIF
jgi:hypothetical protein